MANIVTPAWQKNVVNLVGTERILILVGNINDKYLSFNKEGYSTLKEFVNDVLIAHNFGDIRFFNQVKGFSSEPCDEVEHRNNPLARKRGVALLADKMGKEMTSSAPQAWVIENASHLGSIQNSEDADAWLKIRETVFSSDVNHRAIFLFEKASDIPRAISVSGGFSRIITIPMPDQTQRRQYISNVFSHLSGSDSDYIACVADSLRLRKLEDIFRFVTLSKSEPDRFDLKRAINLNINGFADSPWESIDKEKLENLSENLFKKIKGQPEAVAFIVEKTRAAASGVGVLLDGPNAPKGIAVFGGPTGVGKSELVKQFTAAIFGDAELLVRIDANEYKEEFNCQRLIGAPPGYVGYDQGGQLTNAVFERPFCVILIDEIEKAHPAFWQYLMTVLQDGRLTDGQGNVCSFKNCFLIFTTNLGADCVSADASREERVAAYEKAVEDYFKSINRREIFGRIKDSIVTFNPVTDDVAKEIVEKQLHSIEENAESENKVTIVFSEIVISALQEMVGKASEYGGRDIIKQLNDIIRPELSDIYFENGISSGDIIEIENIEYDVEGKVKLVRKVTKAVENVENSEDFIPLNSSTVTTPEETAVEPVTASSRRRGVVTNQPTVPSFRPSSSFGNTRRKIG